MSGTSALPIVTTLGARALRKLGVAIVADASRPAAGPTLAASDIALRVLLERGIPVTEMSRPNSLPPVGVTELGQRTLRAVGINPLAGTSTTDTTPALTIVQQALRNLGVNPVAGYSDTDIATVQLIASRALRSLGVNQILAGTFTFDVISQLEIASRALRSVGVNPTDINSPSGNTNTVYTRAQMAVTVLLKLAVIASDETPNSTDLQAATDRLTAVHDSLVDWDDVNWGADVVPSYVSEFYIIMAANLLAPTFGKPANMEAYTQAEAMVKDLALSGQAAQTRAMAKVQSVHEMLQSEGLADWSLGTIPDTVSEAYVAMTAALLATTYGKEPDTAAAQAGMAQVRRIVLSGARAESLAEAQVGTVHDEIVADGLSDWTIATIPYEVANAYSMMVVQDLAETYGKPRDMALRDAAKDEVRRIVLSGARAVALGQTALNQVHDEMTGLGLANWLLSAVPSPAADPYVKLLEHTVAPVFGTAQADAARIAAMERLKVIALSGPQGEALAEAKVQAVHERLNAAGFVSWVVTAVPLAFAEDYVAMAAALVAPMYRTLSPDEMQGWQASADAAEGRIKRAGYVAMAQERALVRVQNVHDEMNALGFVSWPPTAIPSAVAEAYTDVAAAQMAAADDGKPLDPAITAAAYQRVRMVAMAGPAGQALANQAVLDVHEDLDARGRIRWTLFDLPPYAENAYVLKAACLLGPDLGLKFDPNWDAMAERQLMQIVSVPSAGRPVQAAYF